MRKHILILWCSFLFCAVHAIEFIPFYTGIAGELNMSSADSVAGGMSIDIFYSLSPEWKTGSTVRCNSDFHTFNSLELLLNAGYLVSLLFSGSRLQLLCGAGIGYEQIWHDGDVLQTISCGTDVRALFSAKETASGKYTLMPYVRFGYPYLWAAGLSCGVLF